MLKKILLILILITPPAVYADSLHHSWDLLLKALVKVQDNGGISSVDYQGFNTRRAELQSYLEQLAAVSPDTFDTWSTQTRLAFLINAYNAWTIELILRHYPVDSIKDIGSWFQSPWEIRFIPLLGKQRTLDEIEHQLIRSDIFREPRIHFAVNCASIGCPALLNEAYSGEKLGQQLHGVTIRFLADHQRNYLRNRQLYLSKIFRWYKEDFERGWQGYESLQQFLDDHLPQAGFNIKALRQWQNSGRKIRYSDYDWALNDISSSGKNAR
ncbi:hypothetical protein VA7868_03443 [Vibrio aerogenes CECT 7868]|uniref:DUF547 domain-containing protein n=1 Tax=Vibrio aerogenes CECT 7868 TaxID=1216006 RepID=A0A1M6A1Q9_9VIBR|nr:DUF547 domain-containing protein [Vibrio aerogenes]SHI30396.1 hypothetical protein VA7868_03443 [Vibrio aerogenes CECT 7868]